MSNFNTETNRRATQTLLIQEKTCAPLTRMPNKYLQKKTNSEGMPYTLRGT